MNADTEPGRQILIFCRGTRRYRTPQVLVALAVCLLMCAVFVNAIVRKALHGNQDGPPEFLLWGGGAVFGMMLVKGLSKFVSDAEEPWEINSSGVRFAGSIWRWDQVNSISTERTSFSKRVWIRVSVGDGSSTPARILTLRDRRPLKPDEYAMALADAKRFLDAHYPKVRVDVPSASRGFEV